MKAIITALTLLLGFLAAPLVAQENSKSRTILILDASGSMWGQIKGKAKIEIARNTAENLIKNRPDSLEMGLMAYGHRRKGDCADIELIVPPGSETTDKLLNALDKLSPKGKTPIFASVLQAAESLKYAEQAASVILVSDGIETCGGDLDALGKLLADKGIDFKTHIIGFAMSDADTVDLRKLARTTGGTYADAGDAAELEAALKSAVVVATKPATSLTLVPLDEDGKSLLKNGVKFTLYEDKASEIPLHEGNGGQRSFEVDPGTYLATATFANRTLEATLTAQDGKNITHTFTFSAPVLSLQAVLKEGDEPLTNGVSWAVYGQPNAEGARKKVSWSYDAQPKLRLAPGDYRITARRGNATVHKDITFSDQPQTASLIFGAGNLKVSATLNEGGEAITGSSLSWSVLGDPDIEGNRPKIAWSYDAQPTFTVPAGSYLVSVKKGNATASQQMEVTAGELTTGQVILGSGILKASVIMSDGEDPVSGGGLSWTVWGEADVEGKRPKVAWSYDAAPQFTIPSGPFTVSVKRGSATTSMDVEVTPGKTTEVQLNLNAAILKTTAHLTEGSEAHTGGGLSWTVFGDPDAEGNRPKIAWSYDAAPQFILPVGNYTVTLKRGSATTQTDLEVVAGKFNTAKLVLNAAIFKATAHLINGGKAHTGGGLSWTAYGEPNAEGNRPKVAWSYDASPQFVLPVGKYLLTLKRGNATTQQDIEILPGKFNTAAVVLNAGLLKVTLADASGTPLAVKPSWTVFGAPNAEGNRPKVAWSYDKVPTWVVPTGSYQVHAKFGDKTATTELEVPAGRLTDFTIKVSE